MNWGINTKNFYCGSLFLYTVLSKQDIKRSFHTEKVFCVSCELFLSVLKNSLTVQDGLTDAFNNYHMGITAENVAKQHNISRTHQDAFAAGSQQKAGAAIKAGHFREEIVSVSVPGRKGPTLVSEDEFPRPETTSASLAKLRPAFIRDETGTVTAGNASGTCLE